MDIITKNGVLYMVSYSFPFGAGETYVNQEIQELAKYFKKIYILPLTSSSNEQKQLPENVEVYKLPLLKPVTNIKALFFSNIWFVIKTLLQEFYHTKSRLFFLSKIFFLTSILCACIAKAKLIKELIGRKEKKIIFYSYWMNYGAIILSLLKQQGVIEKLMIRVHGFDLYDERNPGNYVRFRYFIMRNATKVIAASKSSVIYLKSKKIFPQKVILSYLGTANQGIAPFNKKSIFTIVSCANLIPLKRVDLIIKVLSHLDFKTIWYHFGDGDLKDKIKTASDSLPSNIKVKFMGHVPNEELMRFYKNNTVHLFITLSESEGGVPVSLQEAASFGIPLMGTNCGGIPEIINKNTGILIDYNINTGKIAERITWFKDSKMNNMAFREGVRKFWKEHFVAGKKYKYFYDMISK